MPSYSGNVVEAFIEDLLFPVSTANPDEEHLDFDEKSEVEYHHHKLVSFVCEEDKEMTYEHVLMMRLNLRHKSPSATPIHRATKSPHRSKSSSSQCMMN